jgi:hypothetical protein
MTRVIVMVRIRFRVRIRVRDHPFLLGAWVRAYN